MVTRIITPEQQVQNLGEAIWNREYELESRGIQIREIMALVRRELYLADLKQRVERGEVQAIEVHECDTLCEQPCPDWED